MKILFIICLLWASGLYAKISFSAVGGLSPYYSSDFAYSISMYNRFDEQVLIGVKAGQQQQGIPVLGSLYMRLPFGSIIVPVTTGDIGYFIKKNNSSVMVRLGGGIDWKNGKRSSILILGGYENHHKKGNIYSRIGLLLEF